MHSTLRQKQLLEKGQRLLVAVSGGQDSLCLSKVLLDLQPKWEWHLAIAHCDHRWSLDMGIAEHVKGMADVWQIPFYLKVAEKIAETEAAARAWRYQALIEIARERSLEVVITGHTQSDRAETLLYNLVRGAGADGMAALNWKRQLAPGIELVRPLLNVSRAQTLEFCQQFQLPIWEDAFNLDLKYARNRIRAELLPYLQTHFNPQVEKALARTAEVLRAEVEYLEDSARTLLQSALVNDPQRLNRSCLRSVPKALQRRVMRQFARKFFPKALNFEEIEALTRLIDAPNRTRTSSLYGRVFAEVSGESIFFKEPDENQ